MRARGSHNCIGCLANTSSSSPRKSSANLVRGGLTHADDGAMEGVGDGDEQIGYEEKQFPLPYEPKAPPRTQPPVVFKTWRQETNGPIMTQVTTHQ